MNKKKILVFLLTAFILFGSVGNNLISADGDDHEPVKLIPVMLESTDTATQDDPSHMKKAEIEETPATETDNDAETEAPEETEESHTESGDAASRDDPSLMEKADVQETPLPETSIASEMEATEETEESYTESGDTTSQDDPSLMEEADIEETPAVEAVSDTEAEAPAGTEKPQEIIDPQLLLDEVDDKVFLRKGFKQTFSEAQGYVNEILSPNVIHQYYVLQGKGTDILMSMLPAEKTVRADNKRLNITDGWDDEFHISYFMQRTENLPNGRGGGCWIKYSNSVTKASGSESGVILYPGERAYYFTPADGVLTYEPIADLYFLNQDEGIKFDVIRLNGISYFYANGNFLFSFEDGITGKVSFDAGTILYANGNRVRCDFDDFIMTYR